MIKPRWQLALEAHAERFRAVAASRRRYTPTDAVADALDAAAAECEQTIRALLEPTIMLTPAEWAAEQDPPVTERTARRACINGELTHVQDAQGHYLIPAGALRQVPVRSILEPTG